MDAHLRTFRRTLISFAVHLPQRMMDDKGDSLIEGAMDSIPKDKKQSWVIRFPRVTLSGLLPRTTHLKQVSTLRSPTLTLTQAFPESLPTNVRISCFICRQRRRSKVFWKDCGTGVTPVGESIASEFSSDQGLSEMI